MPLLDEPGPVDTDGWRDAAQVLDAASDAMALGELVHSHTFECVRPPLLTAPSHGVAHF